MIHDQIVMKCFHDCRKHQQHLLQWLMGRVCLHLGDQNDAWTMTKCCRIRYHIHEKEHFGYHKHHLRLVHYHRWLIHTHCLDLIWSCEYRGNLGLRIRRQQHQQHQLRRYQQYQHHDDQMSHGGQMRCCHNQIVIRKRLRWLIRIDFHNQMKWYQIDCYRIPMKWYQIGCYRIPMKWYQIGCYRIQTKWYQSGYQKLMNQHRNLLQLQHQHPQRQHQQQYQHLNQYQNQTSLSCIPCTFLELSRYQFGHLYHHRIYQLVRCSCQRRLF